MQIQLSRYCGEEQHLTATGLPDGADALIFTRAIKKRGKRGLFVARDDVRARAFAAACQFFAPDLPTLMLPAWDCLPYDRVSPGRKLAAQRAGALYALATTSTDLPLIIITTISAMTQYVPPRSILTQAGLSAKRGAELRRCRLETYLSENGYSRASTVVEPGDFAIRGGLVDVFSPAHEHPVRLDFFGDDLENIRTFDVHTQRTNQQLEDIQLSPVSEVLINEASISEFRKSYVANFGGGIGKDPIYAAVCDGIRPQGISHYFPLFYPSVETVFDYIGSKCLVALDDLLEEARRERQDLVQDFYEARAEHMKNRDSGSGDPSKSAGVFRPMPPETIYLDFKKWESGLANMYVRRHSSFKPPDSDQLIDFGAKLAKNFSTERRTENLNVFSEVNKHIQSLKNKGQRILIAGWTEGSCDRLGSVFEDHGLKMSLESHSHEALQISHGTVVRIVFPIEHGFTLGKLSILSEQDILGDRLVHRGQRRRAKNFIAEASALQPGDLIIHIDHGLGRYIGLKTLDVGQAPHDCLELEYSGGARLYLPVENIELLSRYGQGPAHPVLDKLGGVAWQSRKARAKKRLRNIAGDLIALAAKRAMRQTEPIPMPDSVYDEFCARFPYVETEDQLAAIEDVMSDLKSGHPMDRLICGDVGFGKTEVALRAAFAVAMNGRQVALVAPTTILCRQHYKTFTERFRGWPVKVRQLSRLVSAQSAKQTKEEISSGRCEIVIGTHALLATNVKFSDLGLLIIDEEQRFGVQHKERLKTMRADIHVMTLTATPIPRTLQMSLSGIRDLSLITTPPVDRLAVRTYVAPFDKVSIRKAILRERYRGGQSFFVVPRITDMPRVEEFLREDVPEIKYVSAHGQMPGRTLEDIMSAFYDGQYDVLLSTSIIESGIDIPAANTMIIYRADRFGLAQLYQMRGRVGRSKERAYAYLTIPGEQIATKGALERLKILQSLDTLGAGFTLASHDLDMRGGGNLLGEEQSGYIKDVGVELYQHMLEEAVAELRDDDNKMSAQSWSPQVQTGLAVLIPESYIEDLNLRLSTYRRIGDIEDDDSSERLAAELIDRFGPLPEELKSLLKVMKIKRLSKLSYVEKVDAGPRGITLTLRHNDIKDPSIILKAIESHSNWRLRPNQTILIKGQFEEPSARLQGIMRALKSLAG